MPITKNCQTCSRLQSQLRKVLETLSKLADNIVQWLALQTMDQRVMQIFQPRRQAQSWIRFRAILCRLVWLENWTVCGFLLVGKNYGERFVNFLNYFLKVKISLHVPILLFRPGSVHNGSANWNDCGQAFPDNLCVAHFPDSLMGRFSSMPGHQSQPIPTSLHWVTSTSNVKKQANGKSVPPNSNQLILQAVSILGNFVLCSANTRLQIHHCQKKASVHFLFCFVFLHTQKTMTHVATYSTNIKSMTSMRLLYTYSVTNWNSL